MACNAHFRGVFGQPGRINSCTSDSSILVRDWENCLTCSDKRDYFRIADDPAAIPGLCLQADSSDHSSEPMIVSQRVKNGFYFKAYETRFPIAECLFQSLQRALLVI